MLHELKTQYIQKYLLENFRNEYTLVPYLEKKLFNSFSKIIKKELFTKNEILQSLLINVCKKKYQFLKDKKNYCHFKENSVKKSSNIFESIKYKRIIISFEKFIYGVDLSDLKTNLVSNLMYFFQNDRKIKNDINCLKKLQNEKNGRRWNARKEFCHSNLSKRYCKNICYL